MKGIERPETTFLKNQRQQLTKACWKQQTSCSRNGLKRTLTKFSPDFWGKTRVDQQWTDPYISFQISSMDSKYLIISDNIYTSSLKFVDLERFQLAQPARPRLHNYDHGTGRLVPKGGSMVGASQDRKLGEIAQAGWIVCIVCIHIYNVIYIYIYYDIYIYIFMYVCIWMYIYR